jgi:hypothetical protein
MQGQFSIRYLGIPIHYQRLTLAEWKVIEERLKKHLRSWICKLLINSVVTNMALHMISFFLFPKAVFHKLDYCRSRFFCKGTVRKITTDWLNEASFVVLKTRVGLVFKTLRSKMRLYWVNGFSRYLQRMAYGNHAQKMLA